MTVIATKPRFKHDCAACFYLGEHGESDLWYCPKHGNPTLIARTSDAGVEDDFTSFPSALAQHIEVAQGFRPGLALLEALKRAREARLPLG